MTNYGTCTHTRRVKRVMFVYGLSEPEARIFLLGWTKGRRAALESYKRAGVDRTRHRVGGPAWEQEQIA